MQPLKNIPLSVTPLDGLSVQELVNKHGNLLGDYIAEFESLISDFVKSTFVVALNSGTSAIHLGLIALNIKPGDEVLVSNFTYVASINPIFYLGANPILIDSEEKTWNMCPDLLERAIKDRLSKGKKPKAIVVVHSFGMPAEISMILNIANKYEIPVLEDAAESFGSLVGSKHTGTWGKVGVLSFNNNKVLTTYGGGALLTEDERIASRVRYLSQQARADFPYYFHEHIGYNYKMSPLNALYGVAQWPTIQTKVNRRREIFEQYKSGLKEVDVTFLEEIGDNHANRWLTTILLPEVANVQYLHELLSVNGIESRRVWNPMHRQPITQGCDAYLNGVSEALFRKGLCLPSGNVSKADVEIVVEIIRNYITSLNGK
jgi:dTDP-4-amino-4,6-dideoxygalactose transaminase